MHAPPTRLMTPMISPDYLTTYGKDKTPAPIAVAINANILPLIEPGVREPNHFEKQLLSASSYYVRSKSESSLSSFGFFKPVKNA